MSMFNKSVFPYTDGARPASAMDLSPHSVSRALPDVHTAMIHQRRPHSVQGAYRSAESHQSPTRRPRQPLSSTKSEVLGGRSMRSVARGVRYANRMPSLRTDSKARSLQELRDGISRANKLVQSIDVAFDTHLAFPDIIDSDEEEGQVYDVSMDDLEQDLADLTSTAAESTREMHAFALEANMLLDELEAEDDKLENIEGYCEQLVMMLEDWKDQSMKADISKQLPTSKPSASKSLKDRLEISKKASRSLWDTSFKKVVSSIKERKDDNPQAKLAEMEAMMQKMADERQELDIQMKAMQKDGEKLATSYEKMKAQAATFGLDVEMGGDETFEESFRPRVDKEVQTDKNDETDKTENPQDHSRPKTKKRFGKKVPATWEKVMQKADKRTGVLTLRQLQRMIMDIYQEIHRSGSIGTELPDFIYEYLLEKYGLKELADQHLRKMVKSAYEFMEKSKRIKNFMRLLGLTDEQYSNDRVELYISLLADVYGRCDLHSLFELENATEGVRVKVALPKLIATYEKVLAPHVPPASASSWLDRVNDLREDCPGTATPGSTSGTKNATSSVDYLNRWVLNGGEIGDFDSFCSLALDLYREAETHRHAMLRNLFMEADDNGDGVLTFEEFQSLILSIDSTKPLQEIRKLFREMLSATEDGAISPDVFVAFALKAKLFSDRAQELRANTLKSQTEVTEEATESDQKPNIAEKVAKKPGGIWGVARQALLSKTKPKSGHVDPGVWAAFRKSFLENERVQLKGPESEAFNAALQLREEESLQTSGETWITPNATALELFEKLVSAITANYAQR